MLGGVKEYLSLLGEAENICHWEGGKRLSVTVGEAEINVRVGGG